MMNVVQQAREVRVARFAADVRERESWTIFIYLFASEL
jgi:hypothetical protein